MSAAQAFLAREQHLREASSVQRTWQDGDPALPSLYISHGAPPLFDDGPWIDQLSAWAHALPKPRAILIVSAHWEAAPVSVSATAAATPLVYDFGGFDPVYYTMTYPTPDAADLAALVRSLMPSAETVHQHSSRGLDHGAWVPLKVMYPLGDIPILQLSLPTDNPERLLELGRRLRPLRDMGILVIGSGFMTHGLPFITPAMWAGQEMAGWSVDFDAWASEALARGDVDALSNFRSLAPGLPYAHPTVEHYTPLFVTLGAAGDDPAVSTQIEGFVFGLSKRSFEAA